MGKKLIIVAFIAFALLGVTSFFWLDDATLLIDRAEATRRDFSVANSYLFVTPLRAKANNDEKIRITVFILNNQGLGVPGREVKVGVNTDLNMQVVQGLTDDYGKAVFDVSSRKQGEFYLEVSVGDKILPQQARLSFY